MAKELFRPHEFYCAAQALIAQCSDICDSFMADGMRLTLRQLYYQLVQANVVPNTEQSYKRVGETINRARLAGLIDWYAIEDRTRRPKVPQEWPSHVELLQDAFDAFKLERRNGQHVYLELWVEKDALAGVLAPLAVEFHVPLMVNRGYSSQSAMYQAAERFRDAAVQGLDLAICYIGDHDPSGEDMVRDIADRFVMFAVDDLEVHKVALTKRQIAQYKPPPNPAKLTDSRAPHYIKKHGASSWEVDALPPRELQKITRAALTKFTDIEKIKKMIRKETKERNAVAKKLGVELRKD